MPVPELSQTEERIVLLAAQGRRRQEIAAVVGVDVRTVDWHLAQANRKFEKASALLDRVLGADRIVEAFGLQASAAVDNQGRKS